MCNSEVIDSNLFVFGSSPLPWNTLNGDNLHLETELPAAILALLPNSVKLPLDSWLEIFYPMPVAVGGALPRSLQG